MEKYKEIERSIIKKYRKEIWSKFVKAVQDYELIKENDKIMVCISGGKDSFLLAKCIQELHRHGKVKFDAHYVVMDPGYNDYNRDFIIDNAKVLNVPIEMFESDIFDVVANVDSKSPCYLCARMRRGYLYSEAQKRGCNKIALGHHFSDVIETTVMGMFYGAQLQAMLPKLHSQNFEGIELIRPLYCVHEDDIIAWKNYNNLEFLQCACRFTEQCALSKDEISPSARLEVKNFIKDLREKIPDVESHIFKSIHNVNVDTFVGYKLDGKTKEFNEIYKKDKQKK